MGATPAFLAGLGLTDSDAFSGSKSSDVDRARGSRDGGDGNSISNSDVMSLNISSDSSIGVVVKVLAGGASGAGRGGATGDALNGTSTF